MVYRLPLSLLPVALLAGCFGMPRFDEGTSANMTNKQCLTIAHRGASRYAPENTIEAFLKAFEQGADTVELDVRLTADGQLVVMHDAEVDRTTDGHGAVRDLTLAQLKKLDAGAWFNPRYKGATIPTLAEALRAIKRRDGAVLVEIKTPESALVPMLVANCIRAENMHNAASVISFHTTPLNVIKKYSPNLRLGHLVFPHHHQLHQSWPSAYHLALGFGGRLDRDVIGSLHRQGHTVYAWTINSANDMVRLMSDGIDGIITDDPALHRRIKSQSEAKLSE
jgi:glycerophosphoryl diester phosphodiesterase